MTSLFLNLLTSATILYAQTPKQVAPPAVAPQAPTQPPAVIKVEPPQEPIKNAALDVPAFKTEEYVYDPTGRRDPFMIHKSFQKDLSPRPSTESATNTKSRNNSEASESFDPLIRMDLDQLKVIGIIWEVANPRALIIDGGDKNKTVRILTRKTKVGRNNGYVAAIREGEIVIIESFEEEGIVNQQPRIFKLQNDR